MTHSSEPIGPVRYKPLIASDETYKNQDTRVSALFKQKVKEVSYTDYGSASISLVSDQASQETYILQLLGHAPSITPVGLQTFNSYTKLLTKLYDLGKTVVNLVDYSKKSSPEETTQKRFSLLMQASYYGYLVCSATNLTKNIILNFNPQYYSEVALKKFNAVVQAGGVLLSAFSALGMFKALKDYRKITPYSSLLNKASNYTEKLQVLKDIMRVSDTEVLQNIAKTKKEKGVYLEAFCDTKFSGYLEEVKSVIKFDSSNIDDLFTYFSDKDIKKFYKAKLGIEESTAKDLSPKGFMGLILYKKELAEKKQNDFFTNISASVPEAEKLKNLCRQMAKVDRVAAPYMKAKSDKAAETLIKTLEASINRQKFEKLSMAVSCALCIAASLTSIFMPQVIVPVIICWLVSNAIEYGSSLQKFSLTVKELGKDFSKATGKYKIIISHVITAIQVGLVIGFLASPMGQAAGATIVAAVVIATSLSVLFHLASTVKPIRKLMVKHAEFVDHTVNQRFARLINMPIAVDEKSIKELEKVNQDIWWQKKCDKIKTLPSDKLKTLSRLLNIDYKKESFAIQSRRGLKKVSGDQLELFLTSDEGRRLFAEKIIFKIQANLEDPDFMAFFKERYRILKTQILNEGLQSLITEEK